MSTRVCHKIQNQNDAMFSTCYTWIEIISWLSEYHEILLRNFLNKENDWVIQLHSLRIWGQGRQWIGRFNVQEAERTCLYMCISLSADQPTFTRAIFYVKYLVHHQDKYRRMKILDHVFIEINKNWRKKR